MNALGAFTRDSLDRAPDEEWTLLEPGHSVSYARNCSFAAVLSLGDSRCVCVPRKPASRGPGNGRVDPLARTRFSDDEGA